MIGISSPGKPYLVRKLAHFELDQFDQLRIVHQIDLVHEHDQLGHADLTGQQDVLTGLGHGAVGGGHHQDAAVHLGGAGDHVLDVVGVTGAVHMGVVALLGLVFDVGRGDGDAAFLFFGRLVDLIEGNVFAESLHAGQTRDGRGQRGLAVVDVADGADVDVRLGPLKFRLAHMVPLELPRLRVFVLTHSPDSPGRYFRLMISSANCAGTFS